MSEVVLPSLPVFLRSVLITFVTTETTTRRSNGCRHYGRHRGLTCWLIPVVFRFICSDISAAHVIRGICIGDLDLGLHDLHHMIGGLLGGWANITPQPEVTVTINTQLLNLLHNVLYNEGCAWAGMAFHTAAVCA